MSLGYIGEDTVNAFMQRANQFWELFQSLVNDESFVADNPELQTEYDRIMTRGESIRSKIDSIKSAIDEFKNAIGLEGFGQVSTMGFIPVIAVAGIAGAMALMGSWIKDALLLKQRIDETKRLQAEGVPPKEAYKMVNQIAPKPFMFGVGKEVMYPALGIAGILGFLYLRSKV